MSFFVSILPLIVALFFLFKISATITTTFSMLILLERPNDAVILLVYLALIFSCSMLLLDKMHQTIKSCGAFKESVEQSVLKKLYDAQQESKEEKKEGKINE